MSSKIILGTVQFGLNYGINNASGKPSEKQVFEMLDYAFQQGIGILDTADAYGNASYIIGAYNQIKPDRFLLNTKFKSRNLTIAEQLQASLQTLHLNQIDTYFFHNYDDYQQFPELRHELKSLKNKKRIKKIGLSIYDNQEFKSAITSDEIDTIQLPFNLLDNMSQRGTLLKEAKDKGKEIQVRSVFLQGLFFKPLNEIPPQLKPLIPHLKNIQEIAVDFNISLVHLALQYAIQQPEIDHVIIGVDNIGQLKRNLSFAQETLPNDVVKLINKIIVSETELLYPNNWN